MGATAEDRVAKRRINELEDKLKKLQRELREIKLDKKQIGHLRKQAERAFTAEVEYKEILDEELKEKAAKIKVEDTKTIYRCKNVECVNAGGYYKNTGNCDVIETGTKLIVICRDCGSRYTLPIKPLSS